MSIPSETVGETGMEDVDRIEGDAAALLATWKMGYEPSSGDKAIRAVILAEASLAIYLAETSLFHSNPRLACERLARADAALARAREIAGQGV